MNAKVAIQFDVSPRRGYLTASLSAIWDDFDQFLQYFHMISIAINGLFTGLLLQVAIGPVFFFIMNLVLQKTLLDGLFAVLAVTIVDYIYILLAILGVGKLLQKDRIKYILGIVSSIVLAIFGIIMISSVINFSIMETTHASTPSNIFNSFISAFIITISNPLTIVFWTSLFTSKAIEKGYNKKELMIFGIFAGLATFVFLSISSTLLSLVRASIPRIIISILNAVVGSILILYSIVRFFKLLKTNNVSKTIS